MFGPGGTASSEPEDQALARAAACIVAEMTAPETHRLTLARRLQEAGLGRSERKEGRHLWPISP
jgi:hypothetical protein